MTVQPSKWTISDFQNLSMLGKGQFGVIYKGIDPYSKMPVALKLIPKKRIKSKLQQVQLRRQIEIHSRLKHRYIAQMYGWFQNQHNVYLVMEFCKGASLFAELRINKKVLKQSEIKKYMKQLAMAVAFLHQRNVMHRDIKLQNVMLTSHCVKLIDFGWAVHSLAEQRKTFCGTLEYLPPEIVKSHMYDFGVDVYSLGVLFYQLFYDEAPYTDENNDMIFKKILKANLNVDKKEVDPEAKDLIKKMMNPKAKERIRIKDVLVHPYLKDVDVLE